MRIRVADPERDARRVAEIYRPAVEGSPVSFEEVAPEDSEMAARMRRVLERLPWLVAEADEASDAGGGGGPVVGYAYASGHRDRAAYRWSVDISVYVDGEWQGRGVGRALYDALLDILRRQGFANAFAGVTLPNPASVALHEAIGMRRVATYERVGYKNGAWHDTAWFGMRLSEAGEASSGHPGDPPAEPIPFPDLPDREFTDPSDPISRG